MGTLYLVSTPIGNLEDITLRALRVLREARLIACEDTRRTAVLLRHYAITTPMLSYHAHNERARQAELLDHLAAGAVALVADAGTPALADPGWALVQAALAAGHDVTPIPGPAALVAAVTASGLVPEGFTFVGFLPRRAGEAARRLAPLAALPHPLVFYEAPHRLVETLERLASVLGDRPTVAARELTKRHEEFRRASLLALRDHYRTSPPRGEFVLIVAGAPPAEPVTAAAAEPVVAALLAAGHSPSQAARLAAQQTGRSRAELYALARRLGEPPAAAP